MNHMNAPQSDGRQIAFIDLEASGLGPKSWPIEVGWCVQDWPVRSVLIKPDPSWSLEAWEKSAEELHQISPEVLIKDGTPPLEVALILNAAFANADVYSDAPSFDGFWLYRLYEAAGVRANFKLHNLAELISGLTSRSPENSSAYEENAWGEGGWTSCYAYSVHLVNMLLIWIIFLLPHDSKSLSIHEG